MSDHVCPWWLAFSFDNPIRRLIHNPYDMLSGLVSEGQTVVDLGCGMGYFTIGMAHMVGTTGEVIAVDLQEEMLRRVEQRAKKESLINRIRLHQCRPDQIGLNVQADFVLAFWMVHETPDQKAFLAEVFDLLKPTASFLLVEPKLHVSGSDFHQTVGAAQAVGFRAVGGPGVALSRSELFTR